MDNAPHKKSKKTYRFVIYDASTFQEKTALSLKKQQFWFLGAFFFVLFCVAVYSAVAYTKIKYFIPGYPSSSVEYQITQTAKRADSMASVIHSYDTYITNIQKLISSQNPSPEMLGKIKNLSQEKTLVPFFITPVNGQMTRDYNMEKKHFAVDVQVSEKQPVLSIENGVVITADWSIDFGYVIAILHNSGFVSVCKHNLSLFKKLGDSVKRGEAIALAGNSGKLSSGTHLHFELWYSGKSLDPTHYISWNEKSKK